VSGEAILSTYNSCSKIVWPLGLTSAPPPSANPKYAPDGRREKQLWASRH